MAFRCSNRVRQFPVVRQQDQPRAVVIQSAHRKDPRFQAFQQIHHRLPPLRITRCTHHIVGLVEREVNQLGSFTAFQQMTIYLDVVMVRVSFGAEFGDHFAVQGDAAFGDQFFSFAARGYPSLGQNLLQTLQVFLIRKGH